MPLTDHADAVDRVFGAFLVYKASPSADRLLTLLRALNSLDEQLSGPSGPRFLDFPEYMALKTLRAYVLGRGDLDRILHVCPLPANLVASDTSHVCLVAMADCRAALGAVSVSFRSGTARAFTAAFKVWGHVADVQPALFNCVVKTFQALERQGLRGWSAAYMAFVNAFQHEEENDLPHFVSGPCVEWNQEPEEFEELMLALYES